MALGSTFHHPFSTESQQATAIYEALFVSPSSDSTTVNTNLFTKQQANLSYIIAYRGAHLRGDYHTAAVAGGHCKFEYQTRNIFR
jgi:hypothetical protein